MAIKFVVGVPRSGKTYYSVYKIYNLYKPVEEPSKFQKIVWSIFPPEEKENFDFTYTNINQFNFDFSPKIKQLKYKELYSKLTRLYDLYLSDADDSALKELATNLELYNSYFVIDECHNFLNKKEDDVITWWLTYHGHLHQEIHLITQDISLVCPKYKGIAEYFYEVYPASTSISKSSFRIGQYKSSGYHQNGKIKDIFIPFNKEVFKLYESGKAQKRGAILKKFAYIIPFLAFAFFFSIYLFSSSFSSSDSSVSDSLPSENNSSAQVTKKNTITVKDDSHEIDFDNEILINVSCLNKVCYFEEVILPLEFLDFYIKTYPPKFFNISGHGTHYLMYSILLNKKLSDIFYTQTKKGVKNEKSDNPIKSPL